MNWERVRLGDVCKIDNGYAFKSKNYVSDKGARIIRITNVQKGKVVDNDPKLYPFEMLAGLERYEIFENDIMMSLIGNVGRVGRFPKEMLPAYINQRVCRIKSIDKKLDETYLFHFLNSDIFEREAIYASAGIAQLNLSTNWVADYIIPLPPMSVQKEIVEKLDKAAAIREKSKALLSHYDALAESLFIELFGDPISNEKGWEKTNIKDICDIKGGKRVPLKHKLVKYDTGLPYIKAGNIKNGKITLDDLEYLLPETQKMIARYIVDEGDVCITVAGTIGNVGIVPKELDKANLTENANKFVIKHEERLSNYFLCYLFQTEFIQEQIRKRTMAVGVPKLAIFRIEELEIPLPPLSLQVKFAEMVENIEEQKARAKAEIEQSEAVFQALLQESFG